MVWGLPARKAPTYFNCWGSPGPGERGLGARGARRVVGVGGWLWGRPTFPLGRGPGVFGGLGGPVGSPGTPYRCGFLGTPGLHGGFRLPPRPRGRFSWNSRVSGNMWQWGPDSVYYAEIYGNGTQLVFWRKDVATGPTLCVLGRKIWQRSPFGVCFGLGPVRFKPFLGGGVTPIVDGNGGWVGVDGVVVVGCLGDGGAYLPGVMTG